MTEREAVGRIIDSMAWRLYDQDIAVAEAMEASGKDGREPRENAAWIVRQSLAKADAILARQEGLVAVLRGFVLVAKGQGLNLGPLIADGDAALTAYDQAKGGE